MDTDPPSRSGFRLTPVWLITVVFCGLAIYVVVKRVGHVSEIDASQGKVVFAGGLGGTQNSEELRDLAKRTEAGEVRPVDPPPEVVQPAASPVAIDVWDDVDNVSAPPGRATDIVGQWRDIRTNAMYVITQYGGSYRVSETSMLYGVPVETAAGLGSFDGTTLRFAYNTALGSNGSAALTLGPDGSLQGMAQDVLLGAVNLHFVR